MTVKQSQSQSSVPDRPQLVLTGALAAIGGAGGGACGSRLRPHAVRRPATSRSGAGARSLLLVWSVAVRAHRENLSPEERLALYRTDLGFENGNWRRDAIWSGVAAGAAQSLLFAVVALGWAAIFGVTVSG